MSAALLQNNIKCNTLEDDRESCLHVLTWTALRFSKHTCLEDDLSKFMRAFDEEYETAGGVRGGVIKTAFLLGRDIPRTVKFDRRPQLDALIKELTNTFAVRYEELPTAEDLKALEYASGANVPVSVMTNLPAFRYRKRLDNLASPNWLVDTFRHHLSDVDSWPLSDEARAQPIGIGSGKKRRGMRAS